MELIIIGAIVAAIGVASKGIYDSVPPPPPDPNRALPPSYGTSPADREEFGAILGGPRLAQALAAGEYLSPDELAKLCLYYESRLRGQGFPSTAAPTPETQAPQGFPTVPHGCSPPPFPPIPQGFPTDSPGNSPGFPPVPQPGSPRIPPAISPTSSEVMAEAEAEEEQDNAAAEIVDAFLQQQPHATDTLILYQCFGLERAKHKSGAPNSQWQQALATIKQVREGRAAAARWNGLRIVS